MSQGRIGFLVVSKKTGFMTEGKDHAAKIFDSNKDAQAQCGVRGMSQKVPVPLDYDSAVRSLLKGTAFCFDTDAGHQKFLGRLRNDMANKPFTSFSKDKDFIRWRFTPKSPGDSADAVVPPADASSPAKPPEGQIPFNSNILVR